MRFVAAFFIAASTAGAQSLLADAAQRGDIASVRQMISKKADVNIAQGDGMTALHWAAERADLAMTQMLLAAKASVTATTQNGNYTPLMIASRTGNDKVVAALIKAGSDVNAKSLGGATALHLASAAGNVVSVNLLLDAKADPNAKESEWGQTPLVFAADRNRAEVIRTLIKRGADPKIRTRAVSMSEQTAMDQAATKKRNEVMVAMLPQSVRDSITKAQQAAAAAATNANGAAAGGADGGPPAAAGAGGRGGGGGGGGGRGGGRGGPQPMPERLTPTQIQEAIVAGREAMKEAPTGAAAATAAAGADRAAPADTADGQVAGFGGLVGGMGGFTPLHHAARQGNVAAAIALIEGGVELDAVTPTDSTSALLMATINGQFDVAMELVKRGANVNLQSVGGATPIYAVINTQWAPKSRFPQPQAVQNQKTDYLELLDTLIAHKADPNVRVRQNLWYFAFNNCGNANCGLENIEGSNAFWRAAYAVDVEAMKRLYAAGADTKVPTQRMAVAAAGGGRGGRGGGGGRGGAGGGRGGAAAGDSTAAGGPPGRVAGGGGDAGGGGPAGRGGAAGGGRGDVAAAPLDPAIDSAAKAVPPGAGVYPIHAAAGVGYGNGFAGNSHRHAPDGWMPAMKFMVEVLHADVNARDQNGYTPLHHAAARGDNEMIEYLVSKGADPKAVARNGRTTVDMANGPVQRLSPIPETIALLEKMGAKNSHKCVSC